MKALLSALLLLSAGNVFPQETKLNTGANGGVESLLDVRRVYVGQLSGGAQAAALRDLIIASLNSTKLFVLTDNEARADAVLKGAADDNTYTDTFDTYEGTSGHDSLGKTGSALTTKIGSITGGSALSANESHHSRERKHEAYATVRLCNKEGDVLWSTTQESLGAKFRGASADVAAKIAHQISLDYERVRRTEEPDLVPAAGSGPKQ
jgi:hypothetical protein